MGDGLQTYILNFEYLESIGFFLPSAGFPKLKKICCLEISRLDLLNVPSIKRLKC